MSTEENKNIVRRYQEIYNSNDLDRLTEVVSEDLLHAEYHARYSIRAGRSESCSSHYAGGFSRLPDDH